MNYSVGSAWASLTQHSIASMLMVGVRAMLMSISARLRRILAGSMNMWKAAGWICTWIMRIRWRGLERRITGYGIIRVEYPDNMLPFCAQGSL